MEKSLSLPGSGPTTSKAESVRIPRTEEFYCQIYQQVATGIAITDWQGVFQECNPAFCALVGYTEKELRTIDFVSLIHPEDREVNLVQVRRLRVGEIPSFEIENRYIHKNGEPVWVRKFVSVLHGEKGEPTNLIALVTNVTERKRAEEAIKESEIRYRRIVETTNEGVWLLDSKLRTSYVNRQMAGMLGYEPGDMIGRSVFDFYFSEDIEHKKQVLMRREQGVREQFEERLRRRDGSELWVQMSATPVLGEDTEFDGAFAMVCDITERKRAEEAIKESEQRFRLMADSAPVMIWMAGLDKCPTYFNRPWLDFTGQSQADLQNGLAGTVHPEDYSKCHDIYCRAFDQRQPFTKECRLKRHDGQYRWMLDFGVPMFHEDGSLAGYIGSCVDITEQKLAEEALSSINRRLIDAQEQERSRIARELHDDINQRLALVAVELDRQRVDLGSTTSEMRSAMGKAIKQISDIASDVHRMSHRLHSSNLYIIGLAAAAAGFCREFSKQQNVEVDFQCEGIAREMPEAIALCMFRVLQEALQNAVRHSGAKHFKVSLTECTNQITLTICDEGRGFDPAEALKGSGFGLTSMRERLKLVHGELSIESQLRKGTTIRARVPVSPKAIAAAG